MVGRDCTRAMMVGCSIDKATGFETNFQNIYFINNKANDTDTAKGPVWR